jgi:hypothetical protein
LLSYITSDKKIKKSYLAFLLLFKITSLGSEPAFKIIQCKEILIQRKITPQQASPFELSVIYLPRSLAALPFHTLGGDECLISSSKALLMSAYRVD